MKKLLILFIIFTISTLLFAVEFQEKGNVIIRKNDNGSISTIPKDNNNPDYIGYLYYRKTGILLKTEDNTKADTEIEVLKTIIKKLTDSTNIELTEEERKVLNEQIQSETQ